MSNSSKWKLGIGLFIVAAWFHCGRAENKAAEHVIDCDATPHVPKDDWSVDEHRKGGMFAWDASKVKLFVAERQADEEGIAGLELRKVVKDQPVLNANVLDYLLANQHLIPEEWKDKNVFFWGTIYRNVAGRIYVRSLLWDVSNRSWMWHARCLNDHWDYWNSNRPAVIFAN